MHEPRISHGCDRLCAPTISSHTTALKGLDDMLRFMTCPGCRYTGGMLGLVRLRSIRWWAARAIFVVLVVFTLLLAWLWISATLGKPHRFFRSTDRFCSYIGFVEGRFVIHYDGGPDQGLVTTRDLKLLVFSWESGGGAGGWQTLDIGLDGWFAGVFLGGAWSWAAWYFVVAPKRRRKQGRCVRCAYDVRNIPSPVCPECGLLIPSQEQSALTTHLPPGTTSGSAES